MAPVGGSIESVSVRGRLFAVAADADSNRKLGGFESEFQANGDGSARKIKTRVTWMLDGLTLEVDEDRDDQQFLQDRADEDGAVAITIKYASGAVYQGTGSVTDELQFSSQNTLCSVSLSGPGRLTKQ